MRMSYVSFCFRNQNWHFFRLTDTNNQSVCKKGIYRFLQLLWTKLTFDLNVHFCPTFLLELSWSHRVTSEIFQLLGSFLANIYNLAATLSNLYVSQKIANTYRITYSKAECLRTCLTSRISHSYIVTKTDCTDSQTMNIMFTMQFVHFYNFLSPFHIN